MSRYARSFLLVNLGAEMVFAVVQRLQAQRLEPDRSALVLDEMISALASEPFIAESLRPQATFPEQAIKDLIVRIAESSVVRMDNEVMATMWDLSMMVFKWQMSMTEDVMKLTQRHLYELETYVIHEDTHLQVHQLQNIVEYYTDILSARQVNKLRHTISAWLNGCNVPVSFLVHVGLQDSEGNFVVENLNPEAQRMLRNLGENIYTLAQHDKKKETVSRYMESTVQDAQNCRQDDNHNEANRLEMLANHLGGPPTVRATRTVM